MPSGVENSSDTSLFFMNKIHISFSSSYRFRRFARKAWSAFASLHREVTIGAVRACVTEREMLKAGRAVALSLLLLSSGVVFADDQSAEGVTLDDLDLRLQEVLVVSSQAAIHSDAYRLVSVLSHDDIADLPVQTVADVLRYLPGVDVRTRGANGGQADIAMRGGTFDQVLVMLNGVNLSDAHTGHYAMNLPVSVDLIERVEVLQGTSAHLFGLNAYAGAINIITRTPARESATLRLTAGMNGLVNPALATRVAKGDWWLNASAEYNRSEGYQAPDASESEQEALRNTDLQLCNLYVQTGWRDLEFQAGVQWKDAGAGMFYGSSLDQFDATRTAFGSAAYQHRWGRWSLRGQVAYRANYDRYEWHRGQRLYGNFHFSQNTSASLQGSYASRIGTTTLGLELRNENLHSTNLGDTVNPNGQVPNVQGFPLKDVRVLDLVRGKNRINLNYFAEQTFHWNSLNASVGVAGNWNDMFGANVSGGVNLGYQFLSKGSVYLNANRSLRLPTFTDLYYDAGNQLGNRDLKPEEAWMLSLGSKYEKDWEKAGRLTASADAYYRWGRNTIDWVYTPEDTRRPYHAENWQQVDVAGVEATIGYGLNDWLRHVSATYAYTWMDLDTKAGSRYLDYLSHKFVFSLNHGIAPMRVQGERCMLGANWQLMYQQREGEYTNTDKQVVGYRPVWLLDAQLYWEHPMVRVAVDATNITNRHYYDYGGVLQPGAWVKLSLTCKL